MVRRPRTRPQVRKILTLPSELDLHPKWLDDLIINENFYLSLDMLWGYNPDGSKLIYATSENCVQAATFGSGMRDYTVLTGTSADSYNATHTIEDGNTYQKADILVESNNAVVSFKHPLTDVWGSDYIVNVGFLSIEIVNKGVRIKNRTAGSNADYQLVVFK